MEFRNHTPLAFSPCVQLDASGAELLIVALKATFTITGSDLVLAPVQEPLCAADEFRGDPAASSIRADAELGPPKPSTDVLVRGSAVARRPRTRAMDVLVRVGPVRKILRVFGERSWKRQLGFASVTDPEPFDRVPLVWESAFGGVDDSPPNPDRHESEERNPVGRGFRAKRSRAPWVGEPLPQLEDPKDLIRSPDQRVTPQGVGAIARHWRPRRAFAGTYDRRWAEERNPLLPLDFDDRFHQVAPPDLVSPAPLVGGEMVEVVGCTAEGRLELELPRVEPRVTVTVGDRVEHPPMGLDTVGLDTDAASLRLIWKGSVRLQYDLPALRSIECVADGLPGGGAA